jgi:hypothetical protein
MKRLVLAHEILVNPLMVHAHWSLLEPTPKEIILNPSMETWARGGSLLAKMLEITSTVIGLELVLIPLLPSGGQA